MAGNEPSVVILVAGMANCCNGNTIQGAYPVNLWK